jgi:regulator of protease activity HflC (stomatin/prohibitin superfamily)
MSEQAVSYKKFGFPIMILVLGALVLILGGFLWGLCTYTVRPEHVGLVFNKRGASDPAGHFIVEKGFKGTQREVLDPGLHFFWQTKTFIDIKQVPFQEVPEGKVGVLIAKDGRVLPEGAVLAEDDKIDEKTGELIEMGQKGIRKTFLGPGKHKINTAYFDLQLYDALNIPAGQVGVLYRKIGDPPPDGAILVPRDSNYRGWIGEVQEPGIQYLHPKIYEWRIMDALNIPSGKVGLLTRKIGDPAPAGQVLVPFESNYRGIIREVQEPGIRYLHPEIYSWEIVDAVTIPAGKVGVLTRKVGTLPPPGTILVDRDSDYQGILKQVREPGLYYINPHEFEVEIVDAVAIPDGFVGVMIAKTGKPAPEDQLLVTEGFRGIRQDYLKPGLYYINPYEFDIVPVDTRQQKYEMTEAPDQGDTAFSDAIKFRSNDGFEISIDVTVLYEIQPENAPYVVATLGQNLEDVRSKIIRPGSRSFARLEGSMLKAVEFVSGETRKSFQDTLAQALHAEGARANINVVNTFIRNYTLPESLLEPIQLKVIAEKQREQIIEEQKREEEKAQLARQEALVEQQSQKINAETGKIVAETKAEEQKQVAIIRGEQMLEVAKLDRQAAEEEKLRQIALGEGEATRRQLLIEADNLEELRLNIYKEIMVQFASEIGKQKWVPDMVVGGGSSSAGGGSMTNAISDVINMLNTMVANQLYLQQTGPSVPSVPEEIQQVSGNE